MRFALLFLGIFVSTATLAQSAPAPARTPVLLELFTSEGCSSCPPADQLLRLLYEKQPFAGADLIVLSEHVDYWNQLGWNDPWSSGAYSTRQNEYVKRFGLDGPYTPQLVINGNAQTVGNDRAAVEAAIRRATAQPVLPLTISGVEQSAGKLRFHVDAPPAAQARLKAASLYLALALDRTQSQVARGENAGRKLTHVSVLRSLMSLGTLDPYHGISQDFTTETGGLAGAVRVIVFVQERDYGRVLGVAEGRVDVGGSTGETGTRPQYHAVPE